MYRRLLLTGVLLIISFASLADDPQPTEVSYDATTAFGDLDAIAERGLLRILVTHSETDFFFDEGRIRGIQYEYAMAFLKHLNKGRTNRFHASEANRIFPQFVPVTFGELIPALLAGRGDIAAAFLTRTPGRDARVDFISPNVTRVDEIVVAHKEAPAIERLADLSGKSVYVLEQSSYFDHLQALNDKLALTGFPPVNIVRADEHLLTEDILELVNAGVLDYTICDDFKAELWAKVLPDIRLHPDIPVVEGQEVGWVIRPGSPQLKAKLESFAATVQQGSYLGNVLFNRYFTSTNWINNPAERQERKKFNQLISLFRLYGQRYGFDPLALAAQAYQESRLNHNLRSPRGAVGIMQLLPTTARDPNVGIPRIDLLENNIHAGTKYLSFLRERYFSDPAIDPLNQKLLAWAAYNAGPANIMRIRNDAVENGLNPNIWFGHVENMAARKISREPVRYVASIYKYYTAYRLMENQEQARVDALQGVLEDKLGTEE